MKRKFLLTIVSSVLLLLVLYTFFVSYYIKRQTNTQTVVFLPTPTISDDESVLFHDLVGKDTNLNDGITIELISMLQPTSDQPLSASQLDFVVFNNTAETVKFQDQGFGLEIYTIEGGMWKLLNLHYVPLSSEKVLPPRLKKIDFDIANIWSISKENLNSIKSRNIRLYVHGVGEKTNNLFGAYLDISLP